MWVSNEKLQSDFFKLASKKLKKKNFINKSLFLKLIFLNFLIQVNET